MILKEKDLEKIKHNKVLLDTAFNYYEGTENVDFSFVVYYDIGKGFTAINNNDEVLEYAKKVKDQVYNSNSNILRVNHEKEYIMCSSVNFDVSDEKKTMNVADRIYSIGEGLEEPLFIQIGDDYLFLNQDRYNLLAKEEVKKELCDLIHNKAYGDEYKAFKYKENLLNTIEKSINHSSKKF